MNYFSLVALGYLFITVGFLSCSLTDDTKTIVKTSLKLPHLFDTTHYPPSGVIPMLNRKIFRGRRVSIREHPYVASIRRNVAHYLVGTILTINTVLTVAHPLIDVSIAELSVVVGENYADRGSMLHTVILMIVHEKFNQSTLEHDIALLRIYEDIKFKGSAKSISLLNSSEPFELQAFVTGWGRCDRTGRELCLPRSTRFNRGEKFDPMLRTVSFYTHKNNTYCQFYKNKRLYLAPGMMCQGIARAEDELVSCLAVPGAPLVVGARLAGILSWGFSCGYATDLPLIYTSCPYYKSWIVNNIMILQDIPKGFLFKLFQAKKAYVLKEWMRLTREVPFDTFRSIDRPMEALYVDRILARLSGTVYDIRDYLYGGIHHQYKINLYEKMRQDIVTNIEKEKYATKLHEMYEARNKNIKPFLAYNYENQDY